MPLQIIAGIWSSFGGEVFKELVGLFKNKKMRKEQRLLALLQLEDAEGIVKSLGQRLNNQTEPITEGDVRILILELSIIERSVDRVGDLLRGSDDDAPTP